MKKKLLQIAISEAYDKGGVKSIFECVLNGVDESRKIAKEDMGSDYNEYEFQCGRIAAQLEIIKNIISLKAVSKSKKDRIEIANYLMNLANDLKNIKSETKEENTEFKVGDIVEYIGDSWKEGVTNPCKIVDKYEYSNSFACMDKNGLTWFLKENEFKKWDK